MPNPFNGKYIIMLDDDMELWPQMWPARTIDSTLAAAEARGQYTKNPTLLAKSDYSVTFVENKPLKDPQGSVHKGGIYILNANT
jgi:hypothetical protein